MTRSLARSGFHLFLAARCLTRATVVIQRLKKEIPTADIEFLQLDLADLDSVRQCAAQFKV